MALVTLYGTAPVQDLLRNPTLLYRIFPRTGVVFAWGGHVLVTEFRGMALNSYFVLMCYGHSISPRSLTLPTNTTQPRTGTGCAGASWIAKSYRFFEHAFPALWHIVITSHGTMPRFGVYGDVGPPVLPVLPVQVISRGNIIDAGTDVTRLQATFTTHPGIFSCFF